MKTIVTLTIILCLAADVAFAQDARGSLAGASTDAGARPRRPKR